MLRKKIALAATSVAALVALTACGGSAENTNTEASLDPANPVVVSVGASPVPHAQILEFIDENLAQDAGIDLEITEIEDYQTPNIALADGTLDANYFQTAAYLADQVAQKGYEFEHGAGVHIEPLTAFSKKFENPEAVTEGASVVLNNDPVNQLRGLRVLENGGLLKNLTDEDTVLSIESDAEKNPLGLKFSEVNSEQVPQYYTGDDSVDIAVINGNYIVQAGLDPEEILVQESAENNPNANFLTWRAGEKTAAIEALEELLHSEEVHQFITDTWSDGSVLPATN